MKTYVFPVFFHEKIWFRDAKRWKIDFGTFERLIDPPRKNVVDVLFQGGLLFSQKIFHKIPPQTIFFQSWKWL